MHLQSWCRKLVIMLLEASLLIFTATGQESRKVRTAKKKAEKARVEQKKQAIKEQEAKRKRHFNLQSKEVQQRMKENEKMTRSYYNKKTFNQRIEGLFNRKNRKKHGR